MNSRPFRSFAWLAWALATPLLAGTPAILNPEDMRRHVGNFNRHDHTHFGQAISYEGHECQWNGPSWPFATSVTLTALANVLNDYPQDSVTGRDYFETLKTYTKSHHLKRGDGSIVPWIDENLHPDTGDWIARTRLKSWKDGTWDPGKGGIERGKDYNHSTYCDLIITGLVGLRPRADDTVVVNPLLPDGTWDYGFHQRRNDPRTGLACRTRLNAGSFPGNG